jgi:hypothetical protein
LQAAQPRERRRGGMFVRQGQGPGDQTGDVAGAAGLDGPGGEVREGITEGAASALVFGRCVSLTDFGARAESVFCPRPATCRRRHATDGA